MCPFDPARHYDAPRPPPVQIRDAPEEEQAAEGATQAELRVPVHRRKRRHHDSSSIRF